VEIRALPVRAVIPRRFSQCAAGRRDRARARLAEDLARVDGGGECVAI